MKNFLTLNPLRKLIHFKMVDLKHMRQGILLLILALLIKIAIGASTGTDFCQLEQVKCMGKPHIGCLSNFPVQVS